jgi:hypothetical protein
MGMKVLDLPGGRGGLRKPYLMPPPAELNAMAAAFTRLDLDEWRDRKAILGWNWQDGDLGADAAATRD